MPAAQQASTFIVKQFWPLYTQKLLILKNVNKFTNKTKKTKHFSFFFFVLGHPSAYPLQTAPCRWGTPIETCYPGGTRLRTITGTDENPLYPCLSRPLKKKNNSVRHPQNRRTAPTWYIAFFNDIIWFDKEDISIAY